MCARLIAVTSRGERLRVQQRHGEGLGQRPPAATFGELGDRQPGEHPVVQLGELLVRLRNDVGRGALEDVAAAATSGWICGTNWIALAPVPITATRLPARCTE